MEYKNILTGLATVVGIIAYIPYFRDIVGGRTKPHVFSWFVWGLLTAIAFIAQVSDGAGPGALVTGFTALASFVFVAMALKWGEKHITRTDWASLVGALVSLGLWLVTKTPLLSVILITIIDALAFYPTFRKSYFKPYQETMVTYTLSGLKFALAVAALDRWTVITALYPLSLVVMNWVFVGVLVVRRRQPGIVN